ncbi:MAG: glycosyltransferase family 4 protein [Candidatus Eremiobacteraeota bacterium]|nr:glycosyltransferase family 4 protein [Candidatus Eremiobacteraeota bacterium]
MLRLALPRTNDQRPKPLALAVDARVVAQDTRGIGRYERAILRRLVVRGDVALTLLCRGAFPFRYRAMFARVLGSDRFAIASRVKPAHDLAWHPANGTFFPSSKPSVVTIHDAVPFRYPNPDPQRRAREQDPFLASVRSATQIVAVSQFGKAEVAGAFNIPPERIDVIYHGIERSFSTGEANALPAGVYAGRYLLFVGDPAEPRKNFAMLYEAHRRTWPENDGPAIVVAGPGAPELPGVVRAGVIGDDLEGASNERMRALYRGAIALALSSFHETFGMPALEAMASGTPVLASRASCLPEICGTAAIFAAPDDADAWAHILGRITRDGELRVRLRNAGLVRARNFDWDASTEAHLALFRRIVEASQSRVTIPR